MTDEAIDVLNEVMYMLLQKSPELLSRLMETPKGGYTELDWYILQMIKLNVTSDTSPYRHKYKPIPVDENADWRRLNIIDEPDDSPDRAEYIRERMQDVRNIIDQLGLSEKAKHIFTWKFFTGESFADWPGPENRKELYEIYKRVFKAILDKKDGKLLF